MNNLPAVHENDCTVILVHKQHQSLMQIANTGSHSICVKYEEEPGAIVLQQLIQEQNE